MPALENSKQTNKPTTSRKKNIQRTQKQTKKRLKCQVVKYTCNLSIGKAKAGELPQVLMPVCSTKGTPSQQDTARLCFKKRKVKKAGNVAQGYSTT